VVPLTGWLPIFELTHFYSLVSGAIFAVVISGFGVLSFSNSR
ncbi:25719_t:CDS:2, partial [Gigaspora rosea]